MFNKLTEKENDAASKLLKFGLNKAARAFTNVLATETSLERIDFDLKKGNEVPEYCTKNDQKVHLLKTELVGDLKGFCHLIFSEEEVEKIQNTSLPADIINNNNPETRLMKLEFLTEIDNMVAGSVISQLANFLDLEMYGNVPSLHVMQAAEVNKYIQAESVVYDSRAEFRASFQMPMLNVSPEFVWLFQEDFVDRIKANADSVLAQEMV